MKPVIRIIWGTLAGVALAGCGTFTLAAQKAPVDGGGNTVSADAAQSTVASLQQLIDGHQVVELRGVRNGSYVASMFFQSDKLGYFVTLAHDQTFWRVIQTDSVKDAESSFAAFAAQTSRLAEVDIDTLRLEAGKRYAQHLVAMNETRLHKLQADAALQQQQGQQVAALQAQARQKAVALSGDLRAASTQLDDVQHSIRQLEQQQGNPALDLPANASSVAAAPAASGTAANSP